MATTKIDPTTSQFKTLLYDVYYVYTQIGDDIDTEESDEIVEACLDAGRLTEFDRPGSDKFYRELIVVHGYDAVLKTVTKYAGI